LSHFTSKLYVLLFPNWQVLVQKVTSIWQLEVEADYQIFIIKVHV